MRTLFFALALLTIAPACKKESQLKDATDVKFRVGQRWSYWARPGEEQSTFTIEKVETHPRLGAIIHLGLDNLKLTKDKKNVGFIAHLVFTRDAVDKSAAKMIDDGAPIPPYMTEYETWKKAVDEGGGNVLTATIAEALGAMEDK